MEEELDFDFEDDTNDDPEDRIRKYSEMTLEDLKMIVPLWAIGKNENYIYDASLHSSANKYKIFIVDTPELLANIEPLQIEMNLLFLDDESEDYRIMTTLEQWDDKRFIDAPILSVKGKLSITDGRHRVKICSLLNIKEIPIAIGISFIEDAKKLLSLKDVKD